MAAIIAKFELLTYFVNLFIIVYDFIRICNREDMYTIDDRKTVAF